MAGNVYSIGSVVTVSVSITVNNVLTNPTSLSLIYRDPTGVDTTVSPVNDSTGNYHYDIPVTYAGTYQVRWVGTGTAQGAQQDSFVVQPLNV